MKKADEEALDGEDTMSILLVAATHPESDWPNPFSHSPPSRRSSMPRFQQELSSLTIYYPDSTLSLSKIIAHIENHPHFIVSSPFLRLYDKFLPSLSSPGGRLSLMANKLNGRLLHQL